MRPRKAAWTGRSPRSSTSPNCAAQKRFGPVKARVLERVSRRMLRSGGDARNAGCACSKTKPTACSLQCCSWREESSVTRRLSATRALDPARRRATDRTFGRGSCGTAAYSRQPRGSGHGASRSDPRWARYREPASPRIPRLLVDAPIWTVPAEEVLGTFACLYVFRAEGADRTPASSLAAHAARLATVAIQSVRSQVRLARPVRDITHQREALSDRLRMATRSAHIGVWSWDVREAHIAWDEQMYVLYGRTPRGQELRYDEWKHAVHADDPRARRGCSASCAARRDPVRHRISSRLARRHPATRQAHAVVQHGADGAALRSSARTGTLRPRNRQREQLRRAKDAAEAATRARSVFIAGMSHESARL